MVLIADDYTDNISDINFETSPAAFTLSPNPYLDYGAASSQQLNGNGFGPGYQHLPYEADPVSGSQPTTSTNPNAVAACSGVSQVSIGLFV